MSKMLCTIHLCTFTLEAPEDASPQLKSDCAWQECPLCVRDEFVKLRNKVDKLTYERDVVLRCIKVAQENLTIVDPTKP